MKVKHGHMHAMLKFVDNFPSGLTLLSCIFWTHVTKFISYACISWIYLSVSYYEDLAGHKAIIQW